MKIKTKKTLFWLVGVVTALVIAGTAAVAFIVPVYVESRLIPGLAARFGLAPGQVHVRRIGWWGADAGPLQFQGRGRPVLTLASLQIDYTPLTLLRGRIQGITLGGLSIELSVTDDGVSLAGLKPAARTPSAPTPAGPPDLQALLPVALGHLDVIQSKVVIHYRDRRHVVPLEMHLQTADLDKGMLKGEVHLRILGNALVLSAAMDQPANSARLTLAGEDFALESLSRLDELPAEASLSGRLRFDAWATMQLAPLAMTGLGVSGHLTGLRAVAGAVVVENLPTAQGDAQPIAFSVNARDAAQIQWRCGPFQLNGPVQSAVTAFSGRWARSAAAWSLDGQADLLIPGQRLAGGLVLEKALPTVWTLKAAEAAGENLQFKILSGPIQPLALGVSGLRFAPEQCGIEINGRYGDQGLEAQGALSLADLHLALPGGEVTAAGLKIGGTLAVAPSTVRSAPRVALQAVIDQVRARLGDAVMTLPQLQLQAHSRGETAPAWALAGDLKLAAARMEDRPHKLVLEGLSANLPVCWPPADKVPSGRLDLRTMQWEGRRLGGIKGSLQQNGPALEMNLEHQSGLLAGLSVLIKGRLDAAGVHAQVRVPPYRPPQAVDLGRFVPAAANFQADGRIAADADLELVHGEPRGRAALKIDQGSLVQDAQELKLEGIETALVIDDIATLKSAPQQTLRVAHLQLGKLAAEKLAVDFQLEPQRSLLVEKATLQWCQGRINAAAIRVSPGRQDYDITLFCDRLNLAMVLEQLGAAQAGGEGTVNGRIPVSWVNGRLSFDNGFLYSTPGQPGIIKLKGTEVLLSGMAPGTPQYTQLDIATEALKDYTYQWAKLSMQSENDILLLKLQLDGKPNRLMPFAYDQALGQFARVRGEGQAEFKGIGIDLNFKSPLNEIIRFKALLKHN
jgi:hypothetical protein